MIAENPNPAQAPNAKGANKHPGVKKGVKGFLKGKSGNPAGRPPGSRCQATLMAQALFDDKGQAIVEKIIELALEKGDLTALKLCIDRILPLLKSRHVPFALPEIRTAKDIVAAYGAVLNAVSEGHLTPDEATSVSSILEAMRRATDSADTDERLKRIEAVLEARA